MQKKVSIIIPACNEQDYLKKTIDSLRNQDYSNIEIIVVANGSKDKTPEVAKKYADKAFFYPKPLGANLARIKGVEKANGEIFIFLDADSQLSKNAVSSISDAASSNTIGTCLGRADGENIKAKLFFGFKNLIHRLKMYKGVIDGIIFCNRDIYFKINGFDKKNIIAEFRDFINRAIKVGAKYKCLTNCYAIVSTRRYEKEGYLKVFSFWFKWLISAIFRRGDKTASKYWSKK